MDLSWQRLRIRFLGLVFLGIIISLIRFILFPVKNAQLEFHALEFPTNVSLSLWELRSSKKIWPQRKKEKVQKSIKMINGHQYEFSNMSKSLTIDMRYIVNSTGETSDYLNTFYGWKTSPGKVEKASQELKEIGYYSIHFHKDNAVLNSCINPNGKNTVIGRQFVQNRNTSDLRLKRFLPWILNQIPLKDERCLWVYMALTSSDEAINQEQYSTILHDAWVSWYQGWKTRFPKEY